MKKQRVYLDTSVFGGYYDIEFEEFTRPFFNRIMEGKFKILLSAALQRELQNAPERVQKLVLDLNADYTEFVDEDNETLTLANEYVREKVVGMTSFADCVHIALATINNADLLISWNFKHIVNVDRIRSYNSINIKNGYRRLEIRSPRDLFDYES